MSCPSNLFHSLIENKNLDRPKKKALADNMCLKNSNLFNPFPNKPWFLHVRSTYLLKSLWKKEKLLITSNFSFSHSFFYPLGELSAIFHQFWNCRLQTHWGWKSVKFVIWERVMEGWKASQEKEKMLVMLVTSIFSFSQNVSKGFSHRIIKSRAYVFKC